VCQIIVHRRPTWLHANLSGHALRWDIRGANQRDQASRVVIGKRVVAHRGGRFASEAAPPEWPVDQVADFALWRAIDLLRNEPDLAERLAGCSLDYEPAAMAVVGVALDLTIKPGFGFVAGTGFWIVPHNLGIGEHSRQKVEIGGFELAEKQPGGFENDLQRRYLSLRISKISGLRHGHIYLQRMSLLLFSSVASQIAVVRLASKTIQMYSLGRTMLALLARNRKRPMTLPVELSTVCSLRQRLEILTERIRQCETARRSKALAVISTGYDILDRALSDGGLHRGTLVEWLTDEGGSGATTLALSTAREACGETGTLVVIDRRRTFYPLAAVACGIDLSRLLVVRPQNDRDETWAIDQALRSGGASAVLAWPERLDDHLFRRLQLAAECGGALGLFLRPARAIVEPSWAEVRLLVEPLQSLPSSAGDASRRMRLTLLRCPGRAAIHGQQIVLNLDNGYGEEIKPQRTERLARRRTA
jgi:hypothetical protein